MDIVIVIKEANEISKLNEVAGATGLSATEYATNIVRGWLQNQIKGDYFEYINTNDVKTVGAVLDSVLQEFKKGK